MGAIRALTGCARGGHGVAQTARSGALSPILNGRDPLADLTRSLDDQIRADAYRARGASPFQVLPQALSPPLLSKGSCSMRQAY